MPLYDNALYLIRGNLEEIRRGGKARAVPIGRLTVTQHEAVNAHRAAVNLPPLEDPEVVFIGMHVNDSRIVRDQVELELAQRKPRAELYSAIPKGHTNKRARALK